MKDLWWQDFPIEMDNQINGENNHLDFDTYILHFREEKEDSECQCLIGFIVVETFLFAHR